MRDSPKTENDKKCRNADDAPRSSSEMKTLDALRREPSGVRGFNVSEGGRLRDFAKADFGQKRKFRAAARSRELKSLHCRECPESHLPIDPRGDLKIDFKGGANFAEAPVPRACRSSISHP